MRLFRDLIGDALLHDPVLEISQVLFQDLLCEAIAFEVRVMAYAVKATLDSLAGAAAEIIHQPNQLADLGFRAVLEQTLRAGAARGDGE